MAGIAVRADETLEQAEQRLVQKRDSLKASITDHELEVDARLRKARDERTDLRTTVTALNSIRRLLGKPIQDPKPARPSKVTPMPARKR